MRWFSLDTDVLKDDKIKTLRRKHGTDGWYIYTHILTEIAEAIDQDNDMNGYLPMSNGDNPAESIAWDVHLDTDVVKESLDTMAEIQLIDPDKWSNNEIYVPKILERKQTKLYLKQQEAGREAGKKSSKQGSSESSNKVPSKPAKRSPSTDIDVDKDKENTNNGDNLSAKKKSNGRYEYPDEYEKIYDLYPNNNGTKKAGHSKWKARRKDGISQEDLVEAVENYAKMCDLTGKEMTYIKHIETFLGPKNHWEEFLDENFDESNYQPKKKKSSGGRPSQLTESDKEAMGLK